jgi:ABC-type amino acid transport substrate-binding protein
MKKIILAAAALAALSTASFAERNYELRDLQTLNFQSSSGGNLPIVAGDSATDVAAFSAVAPNDGVLTAYERQLLNAYNNEHGGR